MSSPMAGNTTDVGYRSARTALEQRIADARRELGGMPGPSPIQRAALSPATRHELAAVEPLIDEALGAAPSLEAVTTLETALPRLAALRSRTDEELRRVLAREQVAHEPAPPRSYFRWLKRTFSLARRCPDLLPDARPHGVGLLTELDHAGARLFLVAHGVHLLDGFFRTKAVECLLRIAAPRGPAFTVGPRELLEMVRSPTDAVAIAPDFDRAMIVRGQAEVARAVLDGPLRAQLLAMRHTLRVLFVGDGVVDLVWMQPLPKRGNAFPSQAELALPTSIGRRLRDAVAGQSAQYASSSSPASRSGSPRVSRGDDCASTS